MCHPKGNETKFSIAAKTTPRRGHSFTGPTSRLWPVKAGHTLETNLELESKKNKAPDELAGELAQIWEGKTQVYMS